MAATKKTIHVICNTHWDREWRFSFQQSRIMLVRMMDGLIELMNRQPDNRCFHLDAHTAILGDYLEIRPEKRDAVARLVSEGRLLVGPWYTLPDETSCDGEGLIRNLLWGHRQAREFGKVMKVGYTPTGFGQIAQMPQIYQGFDIETIIFYRGINRALAPQSEYIWEGPDGSRLVAFRLGRFSRYNFYFLVYRPVVKDKSFFKGDFGKFAWNDGGFPFHPVDPDTYYREYWRMEPIEPMVYANLPGSMEDLMKELAESTTDQLLGMAGDDQCGPSPNMVELCRRANAWSEDVEVKIGSLPEYMAAYKKRMPADLQVVRGEMRHTSKDGLMTDLYGPILSVRSYLKVEALKREMGYFLWTEPYCAFAWTLGREYPQPFLDLALKLLLENEAHDSIGGCALDKIHRDVMHRFSEVAEISDVLLRESCAHLAKSIDTGGTADDIFLTVYNSLPQPRSEVLTVALEVPRDAKAQRVRIFDAEGREVAVQAQTRQAGDLMVQQPADIPVPFYTDRFLVHFEAKDVPPMGYRLFRVQPETFKKFPHGSQRVSANAMENEHLRVTIQPDGTFDLEDKQTGRVYASLHGFEDSGEVGDPWNRRPPLEDRTIYSKGQPATVTLLEDGPLYTSFSIDHEFRLPQSATQDLKARSAETVGVPIRTTLILKRGARRLDIITRLDNKAKDHRLRILFPTGIQAKVSAAAMQFNVEERPVHLPDTSDWVEPMMKTHPHRHFVDLSDGKAGLALITEGLMEYEVSDDPSRTLALTLMRVFQQRNSVRGIEYPDQKDSQCLGEFEVRYALCPHKGDWQAAGLFNEAFAHNVRMKSFQTGYSPKGTLPKVASFLTLEPASLVLSGIKRSENGRWLVVRFSNPAAKAVNARVGSMLKIAKAQLWSLAEKKEGDIVIAADNSVVVEAGAKQIVTLALQLGK